MEILAGRALVSDLGSRATIGATGLDAEGRPHVVTAGHAGGTTWRFHGGQLGATALKRHRPMDCRSVRVEPPHSLSNKIDGYDGGSVTLLGFRAPYEGLRVQRHGARSKVTPGTVTALDQELYYDLGKPLQGLFRTDIRSQRGDSGGPIITIPVDGTAYLVGFVSGGDTRASVTLAQPAAQAFEALRLVPLWQSE